MKASILHPDCQNLVIRNSDGRIIAKSTLYINTKKDNLFLGYSERLGEFESFFTYGKKLLIGVKKSFSFEKRVISELYSSDKVFENSYISIINNANSLNTKYYNYIEISSNPIIGDHFYPLGCEHDLPPIKELDVYNSFAGNSISLEYNKYTPSNIKKKFNIWRIEIPKMNDHSKNSSYLFTRCISPWVFIQLYLNDMNGNTNLGHEINNITVHYLE